MPVSAQTKLKPPGLTTPFQGDCHVQAFHPRSSCIHCCSFFSGAFPGLGVSTSAGGRTSSIWRLFPAARAGRHESPRKLRSPAVAPLASRPDRASAFPSSPALALALASWLRSSHTRTGLFRELCGSGLHQFGACPGRDVPRELPQETVSARRQRPVHRSVHKRKRISARWLSWLNRVVMDMSASGLNKPDALPSRAC